ncbi:MAG: outer membrane receptor for ferrienterochelin and colicins [Bacteroidia bacterium]
MILRQTIFFFLTLFAFNVFGQVGTVTGTVSDGENSIPFANVALVGTNYGSVGNNEGVFIIENVPEGAYQLQISSVGYKSYRKQIDVAGKPLDIGSVTLTKDVFGLEEVVVSGTRNAIVRYNSPVIMNTISSKTFEATQSLSIAEGLKFSPGLRVENNCQNCGFTQLRMNGLDGAYSQILINSRPVFSALAGVYGLEMIPTNMVDRIEVVRGGGSVMFGGSAIAGTVNIITKDPIQNSFEVGLNQSFVNLEASDRTVNFNGSIVSKNGDKGLTFFGFNRTADAWDANDDSFSEIVMLKNNTFGLDAFWNILDRIKIKLGTYYINEFRRGGNKFDLSPHQTDLTEQLQHNIVSSNLSVEYMSKNLKHRLSVYGSLQAVDRTSYYGGGGRVIGEGDTLTADDILAINAYGNSRDISAVGGIQYNYDISKKFMLTAGSEYIYNHVTDEMLGYQRVIDQQVGSLGTYAQLEYKPIERLTLLAGARFDHVNINGDYDLGQERFENQLNLNVVVPRFSAMFEVTKGLKLRASFAQGYRGPQAFDEDLHIETVGGTARFIQIDADLAVERSNSALFSMNFDRVIKKWQMNFVIEGFYTKLNNPFIFSGQTELPSGVAVITKRNGSGATVAGVNLEANVAFGSKLIFQSGATIQTAHYSEEEEIWTPDDATDSSPTTSIKRLLRTPDVYGFFSLVYQPIKPLSLSYSGVVTGVMSAPHVVDVETERTIIERTPSFFENNIKISYTFRFAGNYRIEIFAGMQNIFNSYQKDFDAGANRDAGYVYGPLRPRTVFTGLKFGLN